MKSVSFDFDGTLERIYLQEYAKELISKNIEVWIVTSRFGDDELYKRFYHCSTNVDLTNNDLFQISIKLNIPKERIVFTNMEDKWHFIKTKNFIWHLDDDWEENKLINKNIDTIGIDAFGNPDWEKECETLLKENN